MSAPYGTPTKLFIQMSGAPGSGKSTVARLLRPSIGAVIIDHDVLRSSLLESDIIPFDQAAKQAYLLQWALARDAMEQGLSVIIDSTCNYEEVLNRGATLAAQHGYKYWYVECKVQDIDLLDQRLRTRNPMASQRTAVDSPPVAAQSARAGEDSRVRFIQWIENPCRPKDNAIIVDSTCNPEVLRDQILEQVLPGK
ncbi:ABC transporter [Xylaria sp. FL1777]|nr:ABC transporter [Xylaria sp. FL1777]